MSNSSQTLKFSIFTENIHQSATLDNANTNKENINTINWSVKFVINSRYDWKFKPLANKHMQIYIYIYMYLYANIQLPKVS